MYIFLDIDVVSDNDIDEDDEEKVYYSIGNGDKRVI